MNLLLKTEILLILFLLGVSINAIAQESTPLTPQPKPLQEDYGLFVGIGNNAQSGDFTTKCDDCKFSGGNHFGWTIGAVYQKEFVYRFAWGACLGYNNRRIKASYNEKTMYSVKSLESNAIEDIPLTFNSTAEASFHEIFAMPFLQWTPFDFVFLRIGPKAAFVFSSNIKNTIKLNENTVKLSNGEIGYIEILDANNNKVAGDNSVVVEDNEFPDVNSLQLSVNPMIGLNLRLEKNVFLSPIFEYSIPLNTISNHGTDFKISYFRALLELRIAMKLSK